MSNNKTLIRIDSICLVHKEELESEERIGKLGIFVEAEVSYPISDFLISTQHYDEHRRMDGLYNCSESNTRYQSGIK